MATNKSDLTSEQKRLYAEQVRRLKGIFSAGSCMFSEAACGDSPIRSHTISRSLYLTPIAESNQVLQWKTNHWANELPDVTDLSPHFTNEASTFPGFCSAHDSSLFKCLDESSFVASPEQLFMQAYRTHCRELHCKKAEIQAFPQPEDVARMHGHAEPEKAAHSLFAELNIFSMGVGERDTLIHHQKLEDILAGKDYRRMCSCIIPFHWEKSPFMATTGSFYPDFDAQGNEVQDFGDAMAVLNTIHFSILPSTPQSYAIFSFIDTEMHGPKQFIDSIVNSSRLGDLIAWLPFCYIENTVVRPSWWNSQTSEMKSAIRITFQNNSDFTTSMSPGLSKCPANFRSGITPSRAFWI